MDGNSDKANLPTGQMVNWPTSQLANWPTGQLANWPTGQLARNQSWLGFGLATKLVAIGKKPKLVGCWLTWKGFILYIIYFRSGSL